MPALKRRIYTLDCSFLQELPGKIGKVIEILAKENFGIKGGIAKIIFGEILKSKEKLKENLALGYKSEVDLDLVIGFSGSRRKNIDKMAKEIWDLKEKLLEVEIFLDEEDVEAKRGSLRSEEFIRKFLECRDLTINEVLLIPSEGKIYFTDECLRDTVNSVGILSANHPGTLKRNCGRLIASPRGMVRLIRFLTEGKVKSIYLPNLGIQLVKEEAENKKGAVLGAYGLILIDRYKENETLQSRLMKILNDLSITNLKNFETFKKEEELLFEVSREEKFSLKKKSFKEVQEEISQKEEMKQRTKRELKEKRQFCSHQNKTEFICTRCQWNCKINKCLDCDWVEIIPKDSETSLLLDEIFCNKSYIKADVYWDKDGFFPNFPLEIKK